MIKEVQIITSNNDDNNNSGDCNNNKHTSLLIIINFTLCFIYFVFGIASIVLSIIFFHTLNATWSDNAWKHVAPLSLSVSTIVILLSIFGASTFSLYYNSKRILLSYIIISFLCLVLSYSTGIFALIGASIQHNKDNILNCNNNRLTGVFNIWNNIDIYLHYADSVHCSESCICNMHANTINTFKESELTLNVFSEWKYKEKNESAFTFTNCPQYAKDEVNARYIEHIKRYKNDNNNWIDEYKFAKYWEYIERKFECSGWCEIKYNDPYTLQEKQMYKYVFSDINNGIVKHLGCLNRIIKWIPKMLSAFSGCILICAFLQTITFILTIVICTSLSSSLSLSHTNNKSFEQGRTHILDNI